MALRLPASTALAPRVAAKIAAFLASEAGAAARDEIARGALGRAVGVNRHTWEDWITGPNGPRMLPKTREAAVSGLDLLHQGAESGRGTHRITRADLAEASSQGAGAHGRTRLFVASMIWGSGTTNGRGPRYLAKALTDHNLDHVLDETFGLVAGGELADAYRRFVLAGVGRSFFTKWFWACSLAGQPERVPLILDDRVIATANQLDWYFRPTGKNWPDRYDAYVDMARDIATHISGDGLIATSEHVEWLLFARGTNSLIRWIEATRGPA